MRKPWWKSRKVWGTILAGCIRLWGTKLGVDVDAASGAALLIIGGVGIEGFIDAASAFKASWTNK